MPDSEVPADWPGRPFSHAVDVGAWRWHVQRLGAPPDTAPVILLLHGTAGSTHGWHEVAMRLAPTHHVVALDLPGQGFTRQRPREETGGPDTAHARGDAATALGTLADVAAAVAEVVRALALAPTVVAGHSAGAAIALRLALDAVVAPQRTIGVCPALIPMPPWFHQLVAPLVAPLATHPLVATAAARLAAGTGIVSLLLESTGSRLTPPQLQRYRTLLADPARVRAALAMMARWDVSPLLRELAQAPQPFTAVAGRQDHWVPRAALADAVQGLPGVTWQELDGGHLLPEELPEAVAALIAEASRRA